MAFALERDETVRINCEAVMWKITTRGFALEEVLIMAAMNLLASAAPPPKREKPAMRKSKGDQGLKVTGPGLLSAIYDMEWCSAITATALNSIRPVLNV
jgi:hypothetical protein